MSSFIGHSLAAAALFSAAPPRRHSAFSRATWFGWLVVLASAPDIDYLIPALGSPAHQGSRITHSLAFSLILPLCTVGALYLTMRPESRRRRLSACTVLAGLSHLVLDFLVGVTPLPLFWPLSATAWASPVGVLPSAGRVRLTNYYFYRNLLIETGILVPICYLARELYRGEVSVKNRASILVLLLAAGCFMAWSVCLSR